MKRFLILCMILLATSVSGFAQQDPNDPGLPDSIVIGETTPGWGDTIVYLPVFAVTDDSVAFYNIPLRWTAPYGGIIPINNNYYQPLTDWDEHYDTVMTSQSYIRQIGFSDIGGEDNPVLYTSYRRLYIFTIPFLLRSDRHQIAVIDTTWDDRNLSMTFGLADGYTEFTPGFHRGFIGWSSIDDDEINSPVSFSLAQNYPNPFNSSTEIEFSLPQRGQVSLVIYDIQGREIRRLIDGNIGSGGQKIIWNGTDNNNVDVASGIYFYRLTADNKVESRRMTLLR